LTDCRRRYLTARVVGSCAGDVKSADGFKVSSWAYGDLFFAVDDAQMGVFDDDGDDLAAVTGAVLDVLAGDHDAPLRRLTDQQHQLPADA
jgi:hypothetical protein